MRGHQRSRESGRDSHRVPVYTTHAKQRSYRSQTPLLPQSSTSEHFYGHTQPRNVLQGAIRHHNESVEGRHHQSEFKNSESHHHHHQSEHTRCESGPRNFHAQESRPLSKASYEDHRGVSESSNHRYHHGPSASDLIGSGLGNSSKEPSRQATVRQNFIQEQPKLTAPYRMSSDYNQRQSYRNGCSRGDQLKTSGHFSRTSNHELIQRAESALEGSSYLSRTSTGIDLSSYRPATAMTNTSRAQHYQDQTRPPQPEITNAHSSCLNLNDLQKTGKMFEHQHEQGRLSQTTNASLVNLHPKAPNRADMICADQSKKPSYENPQKENVAPQTYPYQQQPAGQSKVVGNPLKGPGSSQDEVFSFTRNSIQPVASCQYLNVQNGLPIPQSPNFPVLKSPGVMAFSQTSIDCEGQRQVPIDIINSAFSFQKNGHTKPQNQLIQAQFNSTEDSNVHNNAAAKDSSRLSKLMNVFEAASLDLKTYSVTAIDSFEQVQELQKSLGIIASYVDLARREVLDHVKLLQADSAQTLLALRQANERKSHYKNKYRQRSFHQTQTDIVQHQLSKQQNTSTNSQRSRKKIRKNSTRNPSFQSQIVQTQPDNEVMTQSRHQLIEEVKDLTAQNAMILDKFKEFTKPPLDDRLQNPYSESQPVSRLPISRCDDKQGKKDSIHQDSESDRLHNPHPKNVSKVRKKSQSGKFLDSRRLSSTMMKISKGGRKSRAYQEAENSSPKADSFADNQITSPDQVTSFNGETQMANIILTQDEDDFDQNYQTQQDQLKTDSNQVDSRRHIFVFGSSTQQQFDDQILTGPEEDQATTHFSRTTFNKNDFLKLKASKCHHRRQTSSEYRGDYSTNIDFSRGSNKLDNHDPPKKTCKRQKSACSKKPSQQLKPQQSGRSKPQAKMANTSVQRSRGKSTILMKQLQKHTLMSDIENNSELNSQRNC